MLAVPVDDLFLLISDFCVCRDPVREAGDRILGSDEVTILTLLHAGIAPDAPLRQAQPGWALSSLLLISGLGRVSRDGGRARAEV